MKLECSKSLLFCTLYVILHDVTILLTALTQVLNLCRYWEKLGTSVKKFKKYCLKCVLHLMVQ